MQFYSASLVGPGSRKFELLKNWRWTEPHSIARSRPWFATVGSLLRAQWEVVSARQGSQGLGDGFSIARITSGLMFKARSQVDLGKHLMAPSLPSSTDSQIAQRMWVNLQSRSNLLPNSCRWHSADFNGAAPVPSYKPMFRPKRKGAKKSSSSAIVLLPHDWRGLEIRV
jgi:hypothetical protein